MSKRVALVQFRTDEIAGPVHWVSDYPETHWAKTSCGKPAFIINFRGEATDISCAECQENFVRMHLIHDGDA